MPRSAISWALTLAPFVTACGSGSGTAPAGGNGAWLARARVQSPLCVEFSAPGLSAGGYNLVLYERRHPVLMDMNGAIVHVWPEVRASGRAELLPTGHLVVINGRGRLEEYDWEGRLTGRFGPSPALDFVHHDFARLRSGHYLLLVHQHSSRTDSLLEVDRSGREVWRWDSHRSIPEDLARARELAGGFVPAREGRDLTHINSVQELPPNQWFDTGHEEFRPGNILVSARNLNALYVVARPGGEVVWRYTEGLDYQHEARMVPPHVPGAGDIVLFNNGYHTVERDRHSEIVELNPVERSVVWRYRSPGFFSSTGGSQQILANGNLLVTSSRGGRVFELTREGQIVWQWAPPYSPVRVARYPYGFCPQLAALGPPVERRIRRRDPEHFIDADLYSFALVHEVRRTRAVDAPVDVLLQTNGCRRLRLPTDAELTIGYGVALHCEGGPPAGAAAQFGVSIRPSRTEKPQLLLERAVTARSFATADRAADVSLRRETVALARYGRQTVDLCLTLVSAEGGPAPPCFLWEAPRISPAAGPPTPPLEVESNPEILKHQREQLEALGYIE